MDRSQTSAQSYTFGRTADFEAATRRVRWMTVATSFLLVPFSAQQVYYIWLVASIAALFNLARYSQTLMRWRLFASPITMIAFDLATVFLLVYLMGTIITPFSAYFMIPIIIAAYEYRLKGMLIVMVVQLIGEFVLMSLARFPAISFSPPRQILLTVSVTVSTGLFIERLTRIHRQETDQIRKVSHDSEAQSKRLETLVDSVNDGIFVVNKQGEIVTWNTAAESLSRSQGDMAGMKLVDVLQLYPHANPEHEPVNLLKDKGVQHRRDLSTKDDAGVVTDLDITVRPVNLDGAQTTDYIVLCRDITRERSLDEQRSTFIAVASHELRTPITIMEAALSTALAVGQSMDDQIKAVIKQAHDNSVYLGTIVRDLTILAEASNDNIPIQLKTIDSEQLVNNVVHEFKPQAEQKNLYLKAEFADDIPQILSTENHIREIIQNYIINGLKYTHEGGITVRVEPARNGGVLYAVHDTGIGIAPKDQQQLFKKFFRSEDYRTQQVGGTGLGLYLCGEIAQRLNGRVWCESEINKGSTFFLEIPPVSHLGRDQREVVKTEVANLVDTI